MSSFAEFEPPKRVLMGPGPSDVHPNVLKAIGRPTIGHLDPRFIDLMDEVTKMLRLAFRTENKVTIPLSAPGSVGMEACFVNLLEPGERVLVCENGVFGARMHEVAKRCGADSVVLSFPWGNPVDASAVEEALKREKNIKAVAFVHAETSTGVISDAEKIANVSRENGCLVIVDAVTSLGGCPLEVDAWGLDAVYSGSQKCLSCPPGLSPVTLSEKAIHAIKQRGQPPQSWFMDFTLLMNYWATGQKRSYHHTAPVNAIYGLHASLRMLHDEGLEQSWQRHQSLHQSLREGLEGIGLRYAVRPEDRLWQLNAISIPEGVDDVAVRSQLLKEHDLEIGAGLGPMAGKVWRIGLMGQSCTQENVDFCIESLKKVLP